MPNYRDDLNLIPIINHANNWFIELKENMNGEKIGIIFYLENIKFTPHISRKCYLIQDIVVLK